MTIEFIRTNEVKTGYTSWFFYGDTRTGKTTALATFPRPLIIQPSLEDSHISLSATPGIDIVFTDSTEKTFEILSELETRAARAQPHFAKNTEEGDARGDEIFPWQTVGVESITHYCDGLIEEYTKGRNDMEPRLWGKLTGHLRSLHQRLKALPVHIVYISLVTKTYNLKGELVDSDIAFPGGMKMKLPSACGSVVYFDRCEGNPNPIFTAYLSTHSVFTAGTRYQKLKGLNKLSPFRWSEVASHLGW